MIRRLTRRRPGAPAEGLRRGTAELIQTSVCEEGLVALGEFKAYAAGTIQARDLSVTFVCALSGAVAGVKERVDLFGVLVLSFAAASAGGIMRDLLILSLIFFCCCC